MTARDRVIDLVRRLPDGDLPLVEEILHRLAAAPTGSVGTRWDALPEDDEPLTESEAASLDQALAQYRRGECLRDEDVVKRASERGGAPR